MAFYLRKLWTKVTRAAQARAYLRTFSTDDGMLVLHDLATRFHILSDHGGDPFAEGQRSVALHILNMCNFTPEDFALLAESERERQGDDT